MFLSNGNVREDTDIGKLFDIGSVSTANPNDFFFTTENASFQYFLTFSN